MFIHQTVRRNRSEFKINKKLISKLQEQKEKGKNFVSENEIDSLIDSILEEYQNEEDR